MTDLTIERHFNAPQALVFAFLTEAENLLQWWGHEGWTLQEYQLDLTQPGQWFSRFSGAESGIYHMSGRVLAVTPPKQVHITWAWHDDQGRRGAESEVIFNVEPDGPDKSRLILHHNGLPGDDVAKGHEAGWAATLRRLETLFDHPELPKT